MSKGIRAYIGGSLRSYLSITLRKAGAVRSLLLFIVLLFKARGVIEFRLTKAL